MATVPEIHMTISGLLSNLATCYRELAAAHTREANALSGAMQVTASEAGLVASHDVEVLRTEMLALFADLTANREAATAAMVETLLAFSARLDMVSTKLDAVVAALQERRNDMA